ncbi:beta-propeller fold lactonase family protein [Arthrobacter sp. MYb227]|uniref:beta-propeller fold lactonase family protein n=1 Tax=Arthrobacter sp. MYb227 TaxID=1848601 RepID=UPI0035BE94CB
MTSLRGGHYPAEISLDAKANRLYVGVRGPGRIAVLNLGEDGVPIPTAVEPCHGQWPRHHVQAGDALLVANQLSSTISALGLNATDGLPDILLSSLDLESPTCLTVQIKH